jgi:hypothetical protein
MSAQGYRWIFWLSAVIGFSLLVAYSEAGLGSVALGGASDQRTIRMYLQTAR